MADEKKKVFVKPELIKFNKPLDEVTMSGCGTAPCDSNCSGSGTEWMGPNPFGQKGNEQKTESKKTSEHYQKGWLNGQGHLALPF